jgi:hypothetical protein
MSGQNQLWQSFLRTQAVAIHPEIHTGTEVKSVPGDAWRTRKILFFPAKNCHMPGGESRRREFPLRSLTRDLVFWRGKPYSGVYSIETFGTAL